MNKFRQTFAILAAVLAVLAACSGVGAATFSTVYQFTGYLGGPDGSYPIAPPVVGPGGVLFGTTRLGGVVNSTCPDGCGTVFSLAPPASPGQPWTETILHSFSAGSDGFWPSAAVTIGANGVLYGTAGGGSPGFGVVFSLRPPTEPGGLWAESILYNFAGPDGPGGDGVAPYANLLVSQGKILYGTTSFGGAYGGGTVFSLTPSSGGAWTETILHNFGGEGDGSDVLSGLVLSRGVLYGTTALGGTSNYGTVFSLTPPSAPGGI